MGRGHVLRTTVLTGKPRYGPCGIARVRRKYTVLMSNNWRGKKSWLKLGDTIFSFRILDNAASEDGSHFLRYAARHTARHFGLERIGYKQLPTLQFLLHLYLHSSIPSRLQLAFNH